MIRYVYIPESFFMTDIQASLAALFDRIPRRHTPDNVKEIYSILDDYEDLLKTMENDDRYGGQVAPYFDALEPIRTTIKNSNSNKASKKAKDTLFDEASGNLKDAIESLMAFERSLGT
jgi:hypothetical protein